MPDRRYRVLAIATHPVQYMAPIFRRMSTNPAVDLHVVYGTLRGAEAGHDPEFGAEVQWDVPLLDGYSWSQADNRGSSGESFFGFLHRGLWRLISGGKFDAVLCFTGYRNATFWSALTAAKFSKTAFLFGTDTTTLAPRDGLAWKYKVKKIVWPWLFRLADQVIVPSSGSRDLIISLGIPAEGVTMTPYSVDNDWWMQKSSQVNRSAVRESWGAAPDTTVILFCAKLQAWKRPLDLLRAFAEAKLSSALLIFAGEGPLRAQLEHEAIRLGVVSHVRFLGFVNQSQLPAVYTSSDLMVLPSEYEPFAVVVNEAMCCGCPVAASDHVGAARDLVAPVAPGFVYPCGDMEALAAILKRAVTDRVHLQSLARAAFAHIQTWSPERNIAATIEAIRIAVERMGRHPAAAVADSAATQATPTATSKLRE
jgi:glycosyltransferase involved in cell wall biosynthesis